MSTEVTRKGKIPEGMIQGSLLTGVKFVDPEERCREESTGIGRRNMDERLIITEEFRSVLEGFQ